MKRLIGVGLAVFLLGARATTFQMEPGDSPQIAIGTAQLTAKNFDWNDGKFNGTHRSRIELTFRNLECRENIVVESRSGLFYMVVEPNSRYQLAYTRFRMSENGASHT